MAEEEDIDVAQRLAKRLEFCAHLAYRCMEKTISDEARKLVYGAIRSELPECDLDAGLLQGLAEDDAKQKERSDAAES